MRCCEWEIISKHLSKHQSIVICILQRTLRSVLNSLSYLPCKNPISMFSEKLSFLGLIPRIERKKIITWKTYPKTNAIAAPIFALVGVISTCNAPNCSWQPGYWFCWIAVVLHYKKLPLNRGRLVTNLQSLIFLFGLFIYYSRSWTSR